MNFIKILLVTIIIAMFSTVTYGGEIFHNTTEWIYTPSQYLVVYETREAVGERIPEHILYYDKEINFNLPYDMIPQTIYETKTNFKIFDSLREAKTFAEQYEGARIYGLDEKEGR